MSQGWRPGQALAPRTRPLDRGSSSAHTPRHVAAKRRPPPRCRNVSDHDDVNCDKCLQQHPLEHNKMFATSGRTQLLRALLAQVSGAGVGESVAAQVVRCIQQHHLLEEVAPESGAAVDAFAGQVLSLAATTEQARAPKRPMICARVLPAAQLLTRLLLHVARRPRAAPGLACWPTWQHSAPYAASSPAVRTGPLRCTPCCAPQRRRLSASPAAPPRLRL
jgi:hypothetical protein